MCFFICQSNSEITKNWYAELIKILDNFLYKLKNNPSKYTRECFHPYIGHALEKPNWEGSSDIRTDYPISWNILLAQILYPLQLRYLDYIDNKIMNHIF
jgi:hypothetical protein